MTTRDLRPKLRAVSDEDARTFSVVTSLRGERDELAEAARLIRKNLRRAKDCGANNRAAYFDVSLDALETGTNCNG